MQKNNLKISKRDFLKKSLVLSAGAVCCPPLTLLSQAVSEQESVYRRIAMFQENTAQGIKCLICPNECVLGEGELSRCNSRKVHNSKLYTLAYGNPCSANVDPVEKKPLHHFLPGSRAFSIAAAGCNMACLNCQNWTISQTGPDKTRNYDMMPKKVLKECIKNNCKSIAYTYTEPTTFYEYVYETALLAKEAGVKNILISNGYINAEPAKKLCSVIDGANIDLKAFNNNTYLKLTGAKLQPVLDSLKLYKDMGVWLEITNLIIPGWNDNLDEIRRMCRWLNENSFSDTPLHFSRFYPLHMLEQLPPTPVDVLYNASRIAKEEGIKYVYIGNVPGKNMSDTLCPSCNATVIIREGYRIASNTLKEGKCNNCGETIEGVWN